MLNKFASFLINYNDIENTVKSCEALIIDNDLHFRSKEVGNATIGRLFHETIKTAIENLVIIQSEPNPSEVKELEKLDLKNELVSNLFNIVDAHIVFNNKTATSQREVTNQIINDIFIPLSEQALDLQKKFSF